MTNYLDNTLAAILAVVLAFGSIGAIVDVPAATANAGPVTGQVAELA